MDLTLKDNLPFIVVTVVYQGTASAIAHVLHDLRDLEIEIGGMDYGFEINGILGMDFLVKTGAIINLREMKLEFSN